jgi:hypothetical protein
MVLAAGIANASAGVVADYQANFTANTPATGWSYLWNPNNVPLTTVSGAANVGSWVNLPYNSTGSAYETAATGALPLAAPGSFLAAGPTSVSLGQSATQATDGNSHYVILGYTFTAGQIAANGNQLQFHTYNFGIPADATLDPISVEVFKNTTLIPPPFTFPAGFPFSDATFGQDYPFGTVSPGDTLYIALGATGAYSGQNIGIAYTLSLVPEPASIGLIVCAAPLLLRRRRQTA